MTTTTEPQLLDIEHRIICRVIAEPGDWTAVANAQITEEFFENPKHRRVWHAITDFHREFQSVPTLAILRQDFPRETYRFLQVDEPIDYLINELQTARKSAIFELALEAGSTAWEANDLTAVELALNAAVAAVHRAVPIADDMDLTKTADERLAWYLQRQDADDGLVGISTGFTSLDRATSGLQPEQLVTFTGYAKAGKSFLMIDVARAAHLSGERPLFIGFEMSNREQGERFDSTRAGVSLTRLRDGTLSEAEWEKLERAVRSMEDMHSFVLSADRSSTMTLSGIAAKLDQIKPTILFVDGVYMMDDENGEAKGSSQALTNITRGFKRMAQKYKIPIVISTQSLEWKGDRKRGLTRAAIGYSSSFIQDSDVVIGVEASEEDPTLQIIKILASRNCPPLDFYIQRDWDKGTSKELDYNPFESDGPEDDDDFGAF
ncbi:DnaB-like helicase C-terminal domain-containing protein [Streptomyces sp. NPDC017448]|uniref:DnaB-like helicase C-terminal domain-containing protein n=1 Tax=Streptomyces sp. NPDC017448 TaxID=3364996 RepID=UPI00378ADA91